MIGRIMNTLAYPHEVGCMLQLKFGTKVVKTRKESLDVLGNELGDLDFCYAALNKVSRSFAVVIQQLPECMKDAICIFYLVLRGLDSVEDDMDFDNTKKVALLNVFYQKLEDVRWTIQGVGDSPEYKDLLKHFNKVTRCYQALEPEYRKVISSITMKMGQGMAEFAVKTQSIDTIANYNLYCHYVAGLVGHGLGELFSASGLESPQLAKETDLANNMGLFLQKTNIIRDYLEDLDEGRTWWPEEIWSKYAPTLDWFKHNPKDARSVDCLDAMVTDALSLVPDCLRYLQMIKDPKIFHFCAIPQVMAIATLHEVYHNTDVFCRVIKVRKGLSCKMMVGATDMETVNHYFSVFSQRLSRKMASSHEPERAAELIKEVETLTPTTTILSDAARSVVHWSAWLIFILCCLHFGLRQSQASGSTLAPITDSGSADIVSMVAIVASTAFLTGCTGVSTYI